MARIVTRSDVKRFVIAVLVALIAVLIVAFFTYARRYHQYVMISRGSEVLIWALVAHAETHDGLLPASIDDWIAAGGIILHEDGTISFRKVNTGSQIGQIIREEPFRIPLDCMTIAWGTQLRNMESRTDGVYDRRTGEKLALVVTRIGNNTSDLGDYLLLLAGDYGVLEPTAAASPALDAAP